jgi:hypothetical protein
VVICSITRSIDSFTAMQWSLSKWIIVQPSPARTDVISSAFTQVLLSVGLGIRPCREAKFKKSVVAGERDRPDVARRRAQWTRYQDRMEPERLFFIDETWTRTNMAPLRGWAPRGRRLTAKVPNGRWKTMTFVAALRHDRIDAG